MTVIDAMPACFHHPIKVIFLDDNRAFLDAIDLEFATQINLQTLTNAEAAFKAVDNHSQNITKSVFKLMNDVNVDAISDHVINFKIINLLNHIYDKTRFDHVAVLVVDYEMPDINGIDFCKKLKESKIFRIMLTAEADKDIAIKAFNNGLIDKFILKTSQELYSEITLAVHELTRRYFRELSYSVINEHVSSIDALFSNKIYLEIFAKVKLQSQAVEYYMVDNSGSFLFLDKDANPTWFIVRHSKELDQQLELLQGYEVPCQIMESITKKEKILFLLSENEYKRPISQWIEQMFDSKKLDNNYYYSIVKGQLTDSIDWDRVVSYSSYKS